MNRSVYVITPSSQSGKSIVSLGLMQMLQRNTSNVGYFKPLIEDENEKDNHIETILKHFKINMEYHDAYAFSRRELTEYQNQGRINDVYDGIIKKYKSLEEKFDFVLVEGSDFNEEGSIFEVDFNGSLAKSLGIPVLLVIKDTFETVAELVNHVTVEVNSFLQKDINVIGVFVSRCTKNTVDAQKKIVNRLHNDKIQVSVIPNNEELGKPTVKEIAQYLHAHVLFGADKMDAIAKNSIIGGMQLANYLPRILEDCVSIIPGDRADLIVGSMLANVSHNYPNVAGIVLTGGFLPERSIIKLIDGPQKPIPIMAVNTGTFETASKVANIKPKITSDNLYKIKLSINLFESSVDTEALSERIVSVKTENLTPRMFQYNMIVNAKKAQKHIVLPEGNDERIIVAASQLAKDKIVYLTILGDPEKVRDKVSRLGLYWDEERIKIVNPLDSVNYEDYSNTLFELRKSKGLDITSAKDLMLDVSYYGTMMVYKGHADGMVSGAAHTTAHTIK
ncbi:MAG TPA: phosphate acetyltransferase, partial [Niabella sp.]|nr:phosphate acetyltransferase [Niabella sp.]